MGWRHIRMEEMRREINVQQLVNHFSVHSDRFSFRFPSFALIMDVSIRISGGEPSSHNGFVFIFTLHSAFAG